MCLRLITCSTHCTPAQRIHEAAGQLFKASITPCPRDHLHRAPQHLHRGSLFWARAPRNRMHVIRISKTNGGNRGGPRRGVWRRVCSAEPALTSCLGHTSHTRPTSRLCTLCAQANKCWPSYTTCICAQRPSKRMQHHESYDASCPPLPAQLDMRKRCLATRGRPSLAC